ncbi:uncharacterized protein [Hoplias malabaricus]|uniref:uncharacterized protein n=1 Tax=Hoplias malabaricus TaxID=27720 RepID=UPI00346219E1
MVTLIVKNKPFKFLVDSGAAHSVIKGNEINVPLTNKSITTIGAGGRMTKEPVSGPLQCRLGDRNFQHSFLISMCCPVNLLARDLMCKLKCKLESTPTGLSVDFAEEHPDFQGVRYGLGEPLYVYEWELKSGHGNLGAMLLNEAKDLNMGTAIQWMQPDQLHVTATISEGPDKEFELKFFKEVQNEVIRTNTVYVGDTLAGATVTLNRDQIELFEVYDSIPHVSLGKAPHEEWKDVGTWLNTVVLKVTDWRPVEGPLPIMHSRCTNIYKIVTPYLFHAHRVVTLAANDTLSMVTKVVLPTDLADIPDTLWAKGKNDVGLIRNCEPVVITPKSTYRPKQNQYPLRKEALEGIRPVLEALKEAGVIIPCPSSPVRTPIFPVKKPGGDNWRFVQDLQAVNAAVHARAPEVPNPHTILSSIPPDTVVHSCGLSKRFF